MHLVVGMRNNNVDAQRVVLMCDAIDISQCSCRRLGAHHPHARGVLMCALVGGLSFTMWIRGAHVCTWWMACVHQSPCACTWRMACARTMHAPHGGCLCVHLWVDSVSQCGSGVLMCALGGWHVCTNQHVHVHAPCMHHVGTPLGSRCPIFFFPFFFSQKHPHLLPKIIIYTSQPSISTGIVFLPDFLFFSIF